MYQTSLSFRKNKWKTGPDFKLVQNQFEKHITVYKTGSKLNRVSAKQICPGISNYNYDITIYVVD